MAEDGSLSQEEIDALLSMASDTGGGDAPMESDTGGGGSDMGGGEELNLDSLLADSTSGDPIADAMGGASASAPSMGSSTATSGGGSSKDNVNLLRDINLSFTVELGRTQMLIKDVLMLGEGSVVELDKTVDGEVDILINDRLFGRGKLIVMDEYFGVTITHILDPLNRFRNL